LGVTQRENNKRGGKEKGKRDESEKLTQEGRAGASHCVGEKKEKGKDLTPEEKSREKKSVGKNG